MAGDNIDAIQVSLGVDQTRLRNDLRAVKSEFERNVPKDRTINVHVKLFTDQHSINQMFKGLRAQISNLNSRGGPEAFRVTPQMRMDRRGLREFTRDTEIQMRRAAAAGAPIHIPIAPAFNTRAFQSAIVSQLGVTEVPIRGRFVGWSPGGGPPTGGGGGGGGGGGRPTGGPGVPGGAFRGGTPGPGPTAAPPAARPAAAAVPVRPVRGRVDVPSADVYQTPEPPRAARQARGTTRGTTRGPLYDRPAGPAPPFVPYGGGARTVGARVNPGYTEPEGGRVTMGNLRGGAAAQELQGEEREAYQRQQRGMGRTDYSLNDSPEAIGRIRGRPLRYGQQSIERLLRQRRRVASRARGEEPADLAAKEALRTSFHSVNPQLARAFDQLSDPEAQFDYPAFQEAAKASRQAWLDTRPTDKKGRRANRKLMGYGRTGDVGDVDPMLLNFDAALKAAQQFAVSQMNPLAVIQRGDTALRGRGGKVGRSAPGRGPLTVAGAETIEPASVDEIVRRRGIGGRGNGWKALAAEFSPAELSAARRALAGKERPDAPTPITRGRAYGGGTEMYMAGRLGEEGETEAPPIQGGQGMFRTEKRSGTGGTGGGVSVGEGIAREIDARLTSTRGRFGWQERQIKAAWESRRLARPFGPRLPGPPRFAEGGFTNEYMTGLYTRQIGHKFGAPEGHENVARENSTAWKRARLNTIQSMPFCAHCGVSRSEARQRGIKMTADKIVPQSQGGDPWDPLNRQTLCERCQGRKSGFDIEPDMRWTSARPNVRKHPSVQTEGEFLPHGRFFGLTSLGQIRTAMRGRAEGGGVKWTGLSSSRGGIRSAMMVGERGPEIMVEGHNGQTEVIPAHKTASWMDQMGHRQEGGNVGGTIRFRSGGRFQGAGRAAAEAISSGLASPMSAVNRVFVTNWPSFLQNASNFARGINQAGGGAGGAAFVNPQAQARAAAAAAARSAAQAQAQAQGPGSPFGVGAGGVPGAVTGTGRIKGIGASPLERVRAQRRAFEQGEDLEDVLGRARGNITEAMQLSPVRALSVAFGQIAQTAMGGRAGTLRRRDIAQRRLRVAGREEGRLTGLREQRERLLEENRGIRSGETDIEPADRARALKENQGRLAQLRPAIREQAGIAGARATEALEASQNILTKRQQFIGQAVGLGGIIGGTAVFSAAMAAFGMATQAASKALGPLVDQTLGWSQSLETASRAMSEQIQQARSIGGREEAIAARAIAGGGTMTGQLGAVGTRAEAQAASRIAAIGLENARAGIGAGVTGQNALFAGTGGLFGSAFLAEQMGGQLGFMENINKRLEATAPADTVAARRRRVAPGVRGAGDTLVPQDTAADLEMLAERATGRTAAVTDFEEALGRAATAVGETEAAFRIVTDASEDQKRAMIESAQTTDERNAAEKMAAQGMVFERRGGAALGRGGFREAAGELARGMVIPDIQAFIRQNATERRTQVNQIGLQAQAQREQDLPAQFAFGRVAQPPRPFGTTFSTVGADARTQQNMARDLRLVADATKITAPADKRGADALEEIVGLIDPTGAAQINQRTGFTTTGTRQGPGPAVAAFRGLMGQIGQIGGDIQERQQEVTVRQVALQTREYENQLRITRRSLTEAEDLYAAINGHASDTLGGLQGQNMMLERQNQILSRRAQRLAFRSEDIGFKQSDLQMQAQQMQFQQSQRQINFQTAVAGFTAPGLTPEERAARINEAKAEADFAQRQLNIQIQIAKMAREQLGIAKQQAGVQREMFGNQVAQQDNAFQISRIQAAQAVEDLREQLALLEEGRAVQIDTASAEEAIERLRTAQQTLVEEAQTYVTQGQQIRGGILSEVARANAITGRGFDTLVTEITTAWRDAADSYITNFVTPVLASLQPAGADQGGGRPVGGRRATGGIDTVLGPTTFLAGEAGAEHVVVLRNPTKGTMVGGGGMGGGGMNVGGITIVVQGTSDMDEEKLAAAIERRISTKLAMVAGGR